MKIYNVYKKIGQTPFEALEILRKKQGISASAKLTYAGRLDPMANGVLLVLQGATQTKREKYIALGKVYRAQILLGLSTDSYDLLGLPTGKFNSVKVEEKLKKEDLTKVIKSFKGKIELPIPPYSSVIYKGKPLFEWARKGKLEIKDLPKRPMEIKKIKFLGSKDITFVKLLKYIQISIKKVKGDFRQEKILKVWKKLLSPTPGKYQLIDIQVKCASGTYIRSMANEFGKKLGTKATLFSLERLSVGKYKGKDSLKI